MSHLMMKIKNESFQAKNGQISNFELEKSFIPQKKAENMYNTDSAYETMISWKNFEFFHFFKFFA